MVIIEWRFYSEAICTTKKGEGVTSAHLVKFSIRKGKTALHIGLCER